MVPKIPEQRKSSTKGNHFDDLVKYITEDGREIYVQREVGVESLVALEDSFFGDMVSYQIGQDAKNKENKNKVLAVLTHGITDIRTAAIEMAAVASQNTRVHDPAYHFILSWPEHERPDKEKVFGAAKHAIKALGLQDHQYIIAVHQDTDNLHCHISVNRVHPKTFKSHHIEWAKKTLHYAARESELENGWTNDNGIYIVETNGLGDKSIAINPKYVDPENGHIDDKEKENTMSLPAWHDPEGFESWVKSDVNRELKKRIDRLQGWSGLHALLAEFHIQLSDTGSGFRLNCTSLETGEVLSMPASKALRILKRSDLESRWGKFVRPVTVKAVTPDFSNLTLAEFFEGAANESTRHPEHIIAKERARREAEVSVNIVRTQSHSGRAAADGRGSLHELSERLMDGEDQGNRVLLQDAVSNNLEDIDAREYKDMRRSGNRQVEGRGQQTKRQVRNPDKRAERKEERALQRKDLQQRFRKYKNFVFDGNDAYKTRLAGFNSIRKTALKSLSDERKALLKALPKTGDERMHFTRVVAIEECIKQKRLQIDKLYQQQLQKIHVIKVPAISWREWLLEQSNLGDAAALSALRGIVYQEHRDAKTEGREVDIDEEEDVGLDPKAKLEKLYKKILGRLLEQEQEELAIRSAKYGYQRPFEADVLLAQYAKVIWTVTGNGNVSYSSDLGTHLFTDRGSRVTFDRAMVTDDDINLALIHTRQKFGNEIMLTGSDPVFTERMARLADDLGMKVLNPAMQSVIEQHRIARVRVEQKGIAPIELERKVPVASTVDRLPEVIAKESVMAQVRSINPRAMFIEANAMDSDSRYKGPVVDAVSTPLPCLAQHVGHNNYVLHMLKNDEIKMLEPIAIQYVGGDAIVSRVLKGKEMAVAEVIAVKAEVEAVLHSQVAATEKALTAQEWINEWAGDHMLKIGLPNPGNAGSYNSVKYVGVDGIVVNLGRSSAIYPVPGHLKLKSGDKVDIDRAGNILSIKPEKEIGGQEL